MSALTFSLKQRTAQRVDMSPLVHKNLADKTPAEIAAIKLQMGKSQVQVDALFDVSGTDSQHIVISNSQDNLDYIGKDSADGSIRIDGNAGAYTGLGLISGEIEVTGDTGIFAGCEMKNGLLTINGNAGDFLGAALPGNKQGMKGGTILVKGNVGERAGDHMRRGNILIEGDAGDYCGARMIAGTIAVMGRTGRYLGYAMRRGTLLLWNQPALSATFNDCGTHTLAFLPMLFSSFKKLNSKFAQDDIGFNRVQRYGGDMSEMGRGEVLVRV